MSKQYYIQSLLASGYVIDIGIGGGGNPPSEGALLNLHVLNNGGNQLWSFEAAPEHPGYFFIRSALVDENGKTLAIDIPGDGNAQPARDDTLLQVYEKKPTSGRGYENQLWTVRSGPQFGQPSALGVYDIPGFFIESILKNASKESMAIDVQGGQDGKEPANSSPIQLYQRKSSGNLNQLWLLLGAAESFSPKITALYAGALLNPPSSPDYFEISGTGFFPGSQLILNMQFTPPYSMPQTETFQEVSIGNADFAGDFHAKVTTGSLVVDQPGTLLVQVTCSYVFTDGFLGLLNTPQTASLSATKTSSWTGLSLS